MSAIRTFTVSLTIPDNEAFTAFETLARLGIPVGRVARAVGAGERSVERGRLDQDGRRGTSRRGGLRNRRDLGFAHRRFAARAGKSAVPPP